MFPPQIPHVFIHWLTKPGDIIYDPFSGRGTTPLEACRMNRIGLGSDANPLAYLLTAAKINAPTPKEAHSRLAELRAKYMPLDTSSTPDNIRMLYSNNVLNQLTWLREELNLNHRDDRFIMALLLGIMHANYKLGHPARGLSISMPNTFSMSPSYIQRYINENNLIPPDIDVFDLLETKLNRIQLPETSGVRGVAWLQDAQKPISSLIINRPAKLVFTSPPYLNVIKYGKYNWIRLWMIKQNPKTVDQTLMATGSLSKYLKFMKSVISELTPAVREDGYLCLMIGDVRELGANRTMNLAKSVWEEAACTLGWKLKGIVTDRLPTQHKVSRIWGKKRGNATKTDRILILSHDTKHSIPLPLLNPIHWQS